MTHTIEGMATSRLRTVGAVALALPLLLTGCAASGAPALDTADRFTAALASSNGGEACERLTPRAASAVEEQTGVPCAEGILTLGLSTARPTSAEVWGGEAFAESAENALFLTRDGESWAVRAAGCVEVTPETPLECIVDGS